MIPRAHRIYVLIEKGSVIVNKGLVKSVPYDAVGDVLEVKTPADGSVVDHSLVVIQWRGYKKTNFWFDSFTEFVDRVEVWEGGNG